MPLKRGSKACPARLLQAYAAWLGFYNSAKGMGWDKPTLVQQANMFSGVRVRGVIGLRLALPAELHITS